MNLQQTILELWQISRTALSGSIPSRYDRMQYVKKNLIEHHANLLIHIGQGKQLWFEIESNIN